jgi:hypothetical protein
MDKLREAAAALSRAAPWQWEAVRGRIILRFLTRNGVRISTLNDRPYADTIDNGALREGISGLVSAGPEFDVEEP